MAFNWDNTIPYEWNNITVNSFDNELNLTSYTSSNSFINKSSTYFNKDEYELIITDDKYILKPKEEEISNLPDNISEKLFEL